MSDQKKQTIQVIAGKNGIGKSTILNHFKDEKIKESDKNIVLFLNTEENKTSKKIGEILDEKKNSKGNFQFLIRKLTNFILENNFEDEEKLTWSTKFKKYIIKSFSKKYKKYLILSDSENQDIKKLIKYPINLCALKRINKIIFEKKFKKVKHKENHALDIGNGKKAFQRIFFYSLLLEELLHFKKEYTGYILLDEPEKFLTWELLLQLIFFIRTKIKKVNFIFTTHSSFFVSKMFRYFGINKNNNTKFEILSIFPDEFKKLESDLEEFKNLELDKLNSHFSTTLFKVYSTTLLKSNKTLNILLEFNHISSLIWTILFYNTIILFEKRSWEEDIQKIIKKEEIKNIYCFCINTKLDIEKFLDLFILNFQNQKFEQDAFFKKIKKKFLILNFDNSGKEKLKKKKKKSEWIKHLWLNCRKKVNEEEKKLIISFLESKQ